MKRPKGQQKNPARVFWACWPSTLLSILCFLSFTKTLFFPWKWVILFISQCLPFFLLGFVTFPFSLSVSLYLVSCFFCFSLLSCWFSPSLFFCCFFLPCFFVFVSRQNFTFEGFFSSLIFVFWGFLFCFVFQNPFLNFVFSFFQLCVLVNINVFIFQRRPFLKHPVLFCALCKVIIFVKGRFWGQIWLMFEKHCKNEHFSTGLRTWWSKLVRFSGVEGFRVTVIMWARWEKVWGCRPQSRTSKTKISHVGVFSVLILFFGHWCRTIEVINLKRWVPPPPPKKKEKPKRRTKGTSNRARKNPTFVIKKVHIE